MTPALWFGLGVLVVAAAAAIRQRLAPRQQLAAFMMLAALVLALLRQPALAVPLAALAVQLWRTAPAAPRRGAPAPGPSEVDSGWLRMHLDRATGGVDGRVKAGRFAGAALSGLSAAELRALAAEIEAAGDADSLALILAYLDRRGVPREPPPPPAPEPGRMTEAEAYCVLGLAPGASLEEVRAAYRRLIRRVHPDHGGSSALAALLNEAKELLDPG
jgi:hypothetical protein